MFCCYALITPRYATDEHPLGRRTWFESLTMTPPAYFQTQKAPAENEIISLSARAFDQKSCSGVGTKKNYFQPPPSDL
jgi:hypothetical protein